MPSQETRDVEPPAETEQQRVQDDPNVTVVEMPAHSPNFKEKVYGQFFPYRIHDRFFNGFGCNRLC